jgi:hypothetical protein
MHIYITQRKEEFMSFNCSTKAEQAQMYVQAYNDGWPPVSFAQLSAFGVSCNYMLFLSFVQVLGNKYIL